jgi:hypothetical protein
LPHGLLSREFLFVGTLALEGIRFLILSCGSGLSLLGLGGRSGRLLGLEPCGGDKNQTETERYYEETTTVQRHCLQNSCEPLFYGYR